MFLCAVQVVDVSKSVADVPEWFSGCLLNYAENLLRHGNSDGDKTAIITCGEAELAAEGGEQVARGLMFWWLEG